MDIYLARQPIFDHKLEVVAYELLYRSSIKNEADFLNGNDATCEVIYNTVLHLGLDVVTRNRPAFINFTRDLLDLRIAGLLPKENLIVEILETIEPDDNLLKSCKSIKAAGYRLALDDFIFKQEYRPLLEIADIVKVDFLQTKGSDRKDIIQKINNPNIKYLAEKVETEVDYQEGLQYGYSLFQGYFFQRPTILTTRSLDTNRLSYLRLLHEVNNENVQISDLEGVVKRDVTLSYKLLKYINSPYYGFNVKITSVRQAIALLGINEIKKWIMLLALQTMAQGKTDELLVASVIRASFCESIALKMHLSKEIAQEYFLTGIISFLDVFFDLPLPQIIDALPVSDHVKKLLGQPESEFYRIIEVLRSYENNELYNLKFKLPEASLTMDDIFDAYIKALRFAGIFPD